MLLRCCSILIVFMLSVFAQASILGGPSKSYVNSIDRLQLENDLKNGEQLLREILEKAASLESFDRLTEPLRTKRCRWKLCGTGRRYRYNR